MFVWVTCTQTGAQCVSNSSSLEWDGEYLSPASSFPGTGVFRSTVAFRNAVFIFVAYSLVSFIYLYFSTVKPDFLCAQLFQPWPPYACILSRPEIQTVYVSLLGTSSAYSLISDPGSSDGITQNISDKFRIEGCENNNVCNGRFVLNVQSVWNCVSS